MAAIDEGLPMVPTPTNKNRKLRPDKLIATSLELATWIRKEHPSAHLSDVADDVYALTTEAVAKAERIRRPMYWLRLLLTLAFAGLAYGVYWHYTHHSEKEFMDLLNSLKPLGVFAGSAVIFVITLETRVKRWKALKAIHELQSVVHIIDMHQLGKDPMIEKFRDDPDGVEVKMEQYLHCCTALIAIVSKIGQLYLDHFYDASATTAVNEFEAVATGTSQKIWSKILHLGQTNHHAERSGGGD
jgi:hypothetical protein